MKINTNYSDVAETMNVFFSNINGYQTEDFTYDCDQDHISNIISMYKDHHSIIKLREIINITEHFHFTPVNELNIPEKKKKATTLNGIPSKYWWITVILLHFFLQICITILT